MHASRTRPTRWFRAAAWALCALAVLIAFAAGCGGSKNQSSSENSAPAPAPPPAETTAAPPAGSDGATAGAADDLGSKVFAQRCALCHGPDGHGDGPGSKALNPTPRNFHDTAYMSSRTDAQLLETIHKGKGAMPKWGGVLSEAEITAVFAHVRELGKKP
jgi:mono/diheme cytochrome c family protein